MSKDYKAYHPHINVNDGLARVINNLPLYVRLLGKFKGHELADDLAQAVSGGDPEKIIYSAHALKGTSANLGFPTVCKIAGDIEHLAKSNEDATHLLPELSKVIDDLMAHIEKFLADVG